MHTNRNAIVYGLSAGSGLPGHIRFSRSEYRYSMLWFSLIIGFLQKKYTENLEVMKFFILSLSLSLSLSWLRASIYKIFLKYQSLTESPFSGISLLSTLLSEPLHAALTNRGRVSSYPSAVYAGAWNNNARIRRRYAFLLTRNNKSYQI